MHFITWEGSTAVHCNKKSKHLLKRLEQVESPNITFVGEKFPVVLKKGNGMKVIDVDGNKYLDFTACFGVLALGHRSKVTIHAIRKQSAQLVHGMGDVHPTASKVRLLETLAECSPYTAAKSILSLSGGEAVESAMKTAILATGRNRFISFQGGYHGLHMGPLTLNDRQTFTAGFELWVGERNVQIPVPYHASDIFSGKTAGDALGAAQLQAQHGLAKENQVLQKLETHLASKEFAALVVEPIQGRGGERSWPPRFLEKVTNLCKSTGTLVVFDEIYTGFGRTGSMFHCSQLNITPDLLCVGKALGGGLPLSACMAEASLMDVWGKSTGEAKHTSTFLGHPLACATGAATLAAIAKALPSWRKEQQNVTDLLQEFAKKMESKKPQIPFEIRGTGAMHGLWFYNANPGFAAHLAEDLLLKGFLVLPSGPRGDVLSFTPPLIATTEHYAKLLRALEILLLLK